MLGSIRCYCIEITWMFQCRLIGLFDDLGGRWPSWKWARWRLLVDFSQTWIVCIVGRFLFSVISVFFKLCSNWGWIIFTEQSKDEIESLHVLKTRGKTYKPIWTELGGMNPTTTQKTQHQWREFKGLLKPGRQTNSSHTEEEGRSPGWGPKT